jgi:hypothetical protein
VSTIYKREGGGRQKRKLNDKVKELAVYETEIETVSNIYAAQNLVLEKSHFAF